MVSMNKTLQEHIKEAVFAVEQEGILLPLVLEKFAQLIVQECAGLFAVEWGEEKLTGNDVGYVVKKHFGIDNN